jgi:hypothetical protein
MQLSSVAVELDQHRPQVAAVAEEQADILLAGLGLHLRQQLEQVELVQQHQVLALTEAHPSME